MILWLRFGVIVLGSVVAGLLLFLGAAGFTKSKIIAASTWSTQLIGIVILVSALIGTAIGGIDSALVAYNTGPTAATATIPSYVTVRTADGEEIAIYLSWDVLGQDPVELIEWGALEVGETGTTQYWIRNEATKDVWLTFNTTNWVPPNADGFLVLQWTRVNLDGWNIISGDWAIENNSLQVSTTTRDIILIAEDPTFNYEISTKAKITSSDGGPEAQIIFRYENSDNYYFAGLGAYGYRAAIATMDEGSARMLVSGGNPDYQDIELDRWYDLKVRVAGSTFEVYVDGDLVCTADDLQHGYGDIGLSSIHSDAVFNSFVAVDAFEPENTFFEEYFMGALLRMSESEKVTMTLYVDEATTGVDEFSFDIVLTAWDEPPS